MSHKARRSGIAVGITSENSIGIEFVGMAHARDDGTGKYPDPDDPSTTYDWDAATEAQIQSGVKLVYFLMKENNLTVSDIYWHDQIQIKTPGEGKAIAEEIIKRILWGGAWENE